MPDMWIGLSAAVLRRNWWWTGFLTLVCAGTAVAVALITSTSDQWWWGGGAAVAWLASLFFMINRGYGRALLTTSGMEFRTFVGRRSIPCSEITRIEKRQHQTRGGFWWELWAVRVRGRSLTIPGAFGSRVRDAEFEQKLRVIQERWSRAVGG
ncbi:hypothetical protein PEM37_00030 [Streptomyces sp. AD681]|uniref:hypothetical protein n=1 Tax=Streptomyces sp. AD681 TaxID=3019069 RepID=UPI0022F17F07|nr:hypothetical protein [Streptomyces sp. AD681]MDA5139882.1 hypothetical protein [Streptomyces sp. AD681]